MRMGRSPQVTRTRVLLLTPDPAFEQSVRSAFGANPNHDLQAIMGPLSALEDKTNLDGAAVILVDLDVRDSEVQALEKLMIRIGGWPPVVVVTESFDSAVARRLLQMRVADLLV